MDFNQVVTYPMQRDDWIKTTLIGGILVFLGVFLIPLWIVYGYVVRTIRGVLSEETTPPAFGDWGTLLVDGVKAWVITVVYMLIPLIVAGVTIGGSITAMATGTEIGMAVGAGSFMIGLTLTAILSIVFGYLAIVALVNFSKEGQFGAAFDVQTIKTVALNREYAIAWLVSVVIFLVVGVITAIPLVGWIISPFASFYAAVVAANLWAGGYEQAFDGAVHVTQPGEGETIV